MATPIDYMMSSMGSMAWSSLGGILFVFIIFFILLVVFGGLGIFMWWKSYNVRVTVFQPLGQALMSPEELKQAQEDAAKGIHSEKIKDIKFVYIKRRVTHGKYISIKGTAYFAMFMPMLKIKPIPLQLMYSDGIYLLQLSKDIYIPIPRPEFTISLKENMTVNVSDQQEWITWSNMMADRINAKWQNPDAEKKQTLYFVVGICAMVIIGGLILYFVYASAKKGLDVTTFVNNFRTAIQSNPGSLGGIIPK